MYVPTQNSLDSHSPNRHRENHILFLDFKIFVTKMQFICTITLFIYGTSSTHNVYTHAQIKLFYSQINSKQTISLTNY